MIRTCLRVFIQAPLRHVRSSDGYACTAKALLSGVPLVMAPVFTLMLPLPSMVISIRSIERGAGPKTRTPALV